LPIKVFDSRSFLEKVALFFKTAPIMCEYAATKIDISKESGIIERFKVIVAYAVSIRQFAV
jgi:hypothetical protein